MTANLRPHLTRQMRLFITTDYPCSYLPGRNARNLVADPSAIDQLSYEQLVLMGFRRSGEHVYRPHCQGCSGCLSLRIPVEQFKPNRNQRRIWKQNQDVQVRIMPPGFRLDHYRLFERYVHGRHPDGGMDNTNPDNYLSFISSRWSDTWLWEFTVQDQLQAVAVVDHLQDGLSAVYTFFDLDSAARSLGTYAILYQIEQARQQGLKWVYLGYWIKNCQKMAYKSNFKPYQIFIEGEWR